MIPGMCTAEAMTPSSSVLSLLPSDPKSQWYPVSGRVPPISVLLVSRTVQDSLWLLTVDPPSVVTMVCNCVPAPLPSLTLDSPLPFSEITPFPVLSSPSSNHELNLPGGNCTPPPSSKDGGAQDARGRSSISLFSRRPPPSLPSGLSSERLPSLPPLLGM